MVLCVTAKTLNQLHVCSRKGIPKLTIVHYKRECYVHIEIQFYKNLIQENAYKLSI